MSTWLQVDPADDEAIETAADQLREELADWATQQERPVHAGIVEYLVMLRARYGGDGRLDYWSSDELTRLLTEIAPAKAVLSDDERDAVVPALAALIDFLSERDLLAVDSDVPAELHRTLDTLARPFADAIADPSRRSPETAMAYAMRRDGVDLSDEQAVHDWVEAFNARPQAERQALLGLAAGAGERPVGGAPAAEPSEGGPSTLPAPAEDEATLAEHAAATTLLARLRAFLDHLAEQEIALADSGFPARADGEALVERLGTADELDRASGDDEFRPTGAVELLGIDTTCRLALEAGFAHRVDGRVRPAPQQSSAPTDRPLQAWRSAVDALLDHGVLSAGPNPPAFAQWFDTSVGELLITMWAAAGPVELAGIAEGSVGHVWRDYQLDQVSDQPHARNIRDELARHVAALTERLELAGLLQLAVPHPPAHGPRRVTADSLADATAELTPLAKWYLRPAAEELGYTVASVGELVRDDAGALLSQIADWEVGVADAELDVWIDARGDTAAAADLVTALRATQEPAERHVGVAALWKLDDAAEAAVRDLATDPALRPYAISWLVDRGLARPDELTPDDVPTATVDVLAAALLSGSEPDELTRMLMDPAPSHERAVGFVEELWRVDSPHTAPVLATLSQASDAMLAKAARNALNKYRGHRAAS